MANRDGIGSGGLLLAFVAGAVVGAAAALLFAPAAGDETREYLSRRAREGRDRATDAARQGREFLNRQRDEFTTAFDRARQQARGGETADEEPEA